jgi:hypothetical protein
MRQGCPIGRFRLNVTGVDTWSGLSPRFTHAPAIRASLGGWRIPAG